MLQWGISAEFEPRAVYDPPDQTTPSAKAVVSQALLDDLSGTWNLQADASLSQFMDFSDYYVLPESPLDPWWRMSEECLADAFCLERPSFQSNAYNNPDLSDRLWGTRDPSEAKTRSDARRRELSKRKSILEGAAALPAGPQEGVPPGKPKYCMCWWMELDDSPMARWVSEQARDFERPVHPRDDLIAMIDRRIPKH